MEIKVLPLGHIKANCYLISSKEAAVVIDAGFYSPKVCEFLQANSDKQRLILLTHAHFDHIGGAERLRNETGVKIAIGEKDNEDLSNPYKNLSDKFHAHITPFSADILLKHGERISVGDIEFKVIHTPGHTVGGVCYLTGDILFSGDTLFYRSVGRTDFDGGDYSELMYSIKELFKLPDNTTVLSGHGIETTIGQEMLYTPFINF